MQHSPSLVWFQGLMCVFTHKTQIHTDLYIQIWMCIYICVCICAHIFARVYIYTCIHVYMCTYIYNVYMHIHISCIFLSATSRGKKVFLVSGITYLLRIERFGWLLLAQSYFSHCSLFSDLKEINIRWQTFSVLNGDAINLHSPDFLL